MSEDHQTPENAPADAATVDTSQVDPEEFAKNISSVPDEQLAEAMSGELRHTILNGVFSRMEHHFHADKAASTNATIHWEIGGGPEGAETDRYEVIIREGSLSWSDSPAEESRVTFKMDGVTFLKLVTGNASGPMLFMSGKLKIEGDMMFAPQVQSLFKIPG